MSRAREAGLLDAARRLTGIDGFLSLRLADVAFEAGVSIGTFYSHFENKEDLILGLAQLAWQQRDTTIEAWLEDSNAEPTQRVVGLPFIDFLFSQRHPEFFAAEQLASTPSILGQASELRLQSLSLVHQRIMNRIIKAAKTSIDSGGFRPWPDTQEQSRTIDRAVWSLMIGSASIQQVENRLTGELAVGSVPDFARHHCCALFVGLGWTSSDPLKEIKQIVRCCEQYSAQPTHTPKEADAWHTNDTTRRTLHSS